MNEDSERRALIHEFYQIYRPLQKKRDLRLHSHFSIFPNDDDFIEIWEYVNDKRVRQIIRVKEESEIECYRRAIEDLKSYAKKEEGAGYEKERRAG